MIFTLGYLKKRGYELTPQQAVDHQWSPVPRPGANSVLLNDRNRRNPGSGRQGAPKGWPIRRLLHNRPFCAAELTLAWNVRFYTIEAFVQHWSPSLIAE